MRFQYYLKMTLTTTTCILSQISFNSCECKHKKRKYSILCRNLVLYLKQEIMKTNMGERLIVCLPYAEAKTIPVRNTRPLTYITFVIDQEGFYMT